MNYLEADTQEPICALATALSESALGVIRLAGKNSLQLLCQFFSRPDELLKSASKQAVYGRILASDGTVLDDVVVLVWKAPGSYTGQDGADIMAHGNPGGLLKIMDALILGGFRKAGPGEFTLRAFLSGKMDLTQAEAVLEIIKAKTSRAREMALVRLHGGITEAINEAKRGVLNLLSSLNIQLDYDESDVESIGLAPSEIQKVVKNLRTLLKTYPQGRLYQEGVKIVLTGPVNAGKSSLFNRLLQEDRSIVSDEEGTTRDYLEAWISLEGIPVKLFDTAGIRSASGAAEAEGIRRTRMILESAEIILNVVDGSLGKPVQIPAQSFQSALIKVWNKADLSPLAPEGWIAVSASTGLGWEAFHASLSAAVRKLGVGSSDGALALDSLRQKNLLEQALDSLEKTTLGVQQNLPSDMIALDLQEALRSLGEITGEVTTQEVLNHMFGSFCVGK